MNWKLKRLREAARLTQRQVAARLGIQRPSVANWERGRNGPAKRLIPRLADIYGCSVEDLLGATERGTESGGGNPEGEAARDETS